MLFNIKKLLEDFEQTTNLKEFIQEQTYRQFKKSGKNWICKSPFNDHDNTPSFTISVDKLNVFYCFSTSTGGNVIAFLQKWLGLSVDDAALKLIDILKFDQVIYQNAKFDVDLNTTLELLSVYFSNGLQEAYPQEYLSKRSIFDISACLSEGVGYCQSGDDLFKYAKGRGLYLPKNPDGSDIVVFDQFDSALTFTVRDELRQIVGFIIRSTSTGKYFNLKFREGLFNYGIDKVSTIKSEILVVEGVFDVLVLRLLGFTNVIGMSGLRVDAQLNAYLSKNFSTLYLWVDGDKAGKEFIRTIYNGVFGLNKNSTLDQVENYKIKIKCIYYEGFDPDDYAIKYGSQGINGTVANAQILPVWCHNNFIEFGTYEHSIKVLKSTKYFYYDEFINFISNTYTLPNEVIINQVFKDSTLSTFEIEKQIISNVINNQKLVYSENINKDHFSKSFIDIVDFIIKNENISVDTIKMHMSGYSKDVLDSLPIPDQKTKLHYTKLVEVHQKRKIKYAAQTVLTNIDSIDIDTIRRTMEVSFETFSDNTIVDGKTGLIATIDSIINRSDDNGLKLGSKWSKFDASIWGILPKKLIMILGNTGVGKTNLALNWVKIMTLDNGHEGAVFSGEMTVQEIIGRMISYETGLDNTALMRSGLDDVGAAKAMELVKAKGHLFQRIHLVENLNFSFICNKLKYLKKKHDIKYAVIDYAQLIDFGNGSDMDYREKLINMTRTFKKLATDLDIAVILPAQQSDAANDDKTPSMRRIAEAKAMLNDADVAIAIKRKTDKEIQLDGAGAGNIYAFIDKVRYARDKIGVNIQFDPSSLLMSEAKN